jgi:hypothetical protein
MKKLLTVLFICTTLLTYSQSCILANFPLDGSIQDLSINSFSSTNFGTIPSSGSNGTTNGAISFDGVNDYVELNSSSPIITGGPFSVFVKAKRRSNGGGSLNQSPLFSQRANSVNGGGSIINCMATSGANNNNEIMFTIRDNFNSIASRISYPSPTDTNWHCYGFVLESNDSMHIYLDGVKVESGFSTQQVNSLGANVDYVSLGRHQFINSQGLHEAGFFDGDMDDFKVFSCGLSSSEVDSLCGSTPTSNPVCLRGDFPLNGDAQDLSGNNISSSLQGVVPSIGSDGSTNGSLSFDGVNDYVDLNNNDPIISGGPFTISVKAKMRGLGGGLLGQAPLFVQRYNPTSLGGSTILMTSQNSLNQISFVLRDDMNSLGSKIFYPSVSDTNWHCYTFILDQNDSMFIYLDGVKVSSGKSLQQSNRLGLNVDYVSLGRHQYVNSQGLHEAGFFDGDMDDFKVFSCSLNSSEVDSICYITTDTLPTDTTVGIKYVEEVIMAVYPNPASNRLVVNLNKEFTNLNYQIYDLTGRVAQSGRLQGNQVDIERLSSGTYTFLLKLPDGSHITSIVIKQ